MRARVALAVLVLAACARSPGRSPGRDGGGDGDAQVALCGDGRLAAEEACDDGNRLDGDGCSPDCQVEPGWECAGEPSECVSLCGNGRLDPDEECDGEDLGGNTCSSVDPGFTTGSLACGPGCTFDTTGCISPDCGNAVQDPGEECDDGNQSNEDGCLTNCRLPTCGDGYTWQGHEECDDGNRSNEDDCLNDCTLAACGDGYLWQGHEECDDGNRISGDGCNADCELEECGDGIVQPGEDCEPGVTPDRQCTTSCGSTGTQSCDSGCHWSACQPPRETCNSQDDDCDGRTDTMDCLVIARQFSHPTSGDHMYKVDDNTPDPGYVIDAPFFYLYRDQVPGTTALYQVTNGTDHMTTVNPDEGSSVGYGNPVLLGYVTGQSWQVGSIPASLICRYYRRGHGDHMLYRDLTEDEIPSILGPDYEKEGCMYAWGFNGP